MGGKLSRWNRGAERPMPKKGCSVAFYIGLGVLLIFTLVMYIIYRLS